LSRDPYRVIYRLKHAVRRPLVPTAACGYGSRLKAGTTAVVAARQFQTRLLQTRLRLLAAPCARGLQSSSRPFQKEGRRESRAPIAPAVVHKNARVDHRATGSTRLSPRDGFTAYTRPPRGAQLFSPRRPGINDALKTRSGWKHLPKLGASLGRRNNATSPSAPISAKAPAGTRGPTRF